MAERSATAKWNGTLKEGNGSMRLGSGTWEGAYSFKSRFEDDGTGTNPEELIGAAHAGCFSMQVAAQLERAGVEVDSVETKAVVHIRQVDGKPTINRIDLTTTANVPGGDEDQVRRTAEEAKVQCIISRALGAVDEVNLNLTVST